MSDSSSSSSSSEYIYSKDGSPTSGQESPSGQGTISEEDERGSGETESDETEEAEPNNQVTVHRGISAEENDQYDRAQAQPNRQLNAAYRDLLNSANDDIQYGSSSPTGHIAPTRLGGSLWTERENQIFCTKLASLGQDDLPGLSRALGTKSQLEVRAYLLHLRHKESTLDPNSYSGARISLAEIPAASEIGKRCDNALDVAAENLAQYVQSHEIDVEKQKFGDSWLIDEDVAAAIELKTKQNVDKSSRESRQGSKGSAETTDGLVVHDDSNVPAHSSSTASDNYVSFANLLRPEAFIKLSQDLFMNGPQRTDSNWRTVGPYDMASPTPAIFRSALEEFHQLAVNVISRLTRATLIQTISRLRTKEESHPVLEVKVVDVQTACALTGFEADWKQYWASVARRCGVDVVTESEKFRNARETKKFRVKLTLEEVEAELGLESIPQMSQSRRHGRARGMSPSGLLSTKNMSDTFERGYVDVEHVDSAEEDVDSEASSEHGSENQEALMNEGDSEDQEDEYLDRIDEQASQAEERKLLKMLKRRPSAVIASGRISPPKPPKRPVNDEQTQWRKRLKYEAEWEQFPGVLYGVGLDVREPGGD